MNAYLCTLAMIDPDEQGSFRLPPPPFVRCSKEERREAMRKVRKDENSNWFARMVGLVVVYVIVSAITSFGVSTAVVEHRQRELETKVDRNTSTLDQRAERLDKIEKSIATLEGKFGDTFRSDVKGEVRWLARELFNSGVIKSLPGNGDGK